MSVLDTSTPTAPSITSITENSSGGINASEASDGTPVIVSLASTGAISGDTLTINWGGQTVNYTLTGTDIQNGSVTVTVPAATISSQGNGTFNVTAKLTDGAGNVSANSANLSVTVDTVANAPTLSLATDSGNSGSDRVTNVGTVNVSGLESGATWQYSTDGGTNWTAGSGSSFTLSGDGAKSVIVRQTDAAGNTSSNSSAFAFTLDTQATAPTLSLATDSGGSGSDKITNVGTVNVSGLESGAAWQYSTDGGTNWTTGSGSSFTLSGDGAKSVIVRQTDAAGNTSSNSSAFAFTLDTQATAPTLSLATDSGGSGSDKITNVGTVNVGGLESGAAWQYSTDGGTNWTTGSGSSFTLSGDGAKSVIVRQTDAAGNTSSNSSAFAFTLDTQATAPTLSLATDSGGSGSDKITNVGTVNVGGLESGAAWQYSTDGGTNWTTGSGSSFTLSGDGAKSVIVRQTDAAGNTSSNSSAFAFTLDTQATAPTLSLATDSGGSGSDKITNVGTVNVGGLESGAAWQYSTDGGTNWTTGSGSSFTLSGDGAKSVIVRQTDAAGNTSSNSSAFAFTLDTQATAPTLSLATDSGGSGSDKITNVGTVNVGGLESGAAWQYSTDGGTNWTTGSGSSFTLSGDGAKSVIVRQTDAAGNTSSNSSAFAFTLDTQATAPTLSLATDSGSSGRQPHQ